MISVRANKRLATKLTRKISGMRSLCGALKGSDVFFQGSRRSCPCIGLCICPRKTLDSFNLSHLAGLELLSKQGVPAKAELSTAGALKVVLTHRGPLVKPGRLTGLRHVRKPLSHR